MSKNAHIRVMYSPRRVTYITIGVGLLIMYGGQSRSLGNKEAPASNELKYPHPFFMCAKKQTKTALLGIERHKKYYKMKAKVQYGDLEGTVAADMTDGINPSLQEYLTRNYRSYDGKRYDCHGCDIFLGEGFIYVCYICYDKNEGKYVRIRPEKKVSYDELFAMFKRFNVVLGKNMDKIEVDEESIFIS